ncbi:MAG: SDR family oxidoreductase [Ilumatobacteraceae bacterium]
MKLRDKVVVITGAGNGIGAACARRFRVEGATVVVADLEADAVGEVGDEIGAVPVAADMTTEDGVGAVYDAAMAAHGRVDIWFSNAGISGERAPGELLGNAVWETMWNLHVMSHVYASRAVLPQMIERGEGYLLQTCSAVALSMQVEKAAYTVTKHASLALGEWLSTHHRSAGVRVSCFCPGAMLTRMLLSNDFDDDSPVLASAQTPEQVADILVRGIDAERFLIVTPDVTTDPLVARATDYDAWLSGLQRAVT